MIHFEFSKGISGRWSVTAIHGWSPHQRNNGIKKSTGWEKLSGAVAWAEEYAEENGAAISGPSLLTLSADKS